MSSRTSFVSASLPACECNLEVFCGTLCGAKTTTSQQWNKNETNNEGRPFGPGNMEAQLTSISLSALTSGGPTSRCSCVHSSNKPQQHCRKQKFVWWLYSRPLHTLQKRCWCYKCLMQLHFSVVCGAVMSSASIWHTSVLAAAHVQHLVILLHIHIHQSYKIYVYS